MTRKTSSVGIDLPPLVWEICSVLAGLEVTELFGAEAWDQWFLASELEKCLTSALP